MTFKEIEPIIRDQYFKLCDERLPEDFFIETTAEGESVKEKFREIFDRYKEKYENETNEKKLSYTASEMAEEIFELLEN